MLSGTSQSGSHQADTLLNFKGWGWMINVKTFLRIGFAAAALLAFSSANALLIDPAVTPNVGTATGTSNCEPGCVPGADATWDLLYKSDQGPASGVGSDSGFLASSYETTFSNAPTDPADADIVYVGGPSLNCAPGDCIMAVKDGNQDPSYYFYDLGALGWDGTETIQLRNFWPGNGAISHVSIWGPDEDNCCDDDEDVPAPAPLALLGLGLLGFGIARRRRDVA